MRFAKRTEEQRRGQDDRCAQRRARTLGRIWRDQAHTNTITLVLQFCLSSLFSHFLLFLETKTREYKHPVNVAPGTDPLCQFQRFHLRLVLVSRSWDGNGMLYVDIDRRLRFADVHLLNTHSKVVVRPVR